MSPWYHILVLGLPTLESLSFLYCRPWGRADLYSTIPLPWLLSSAEKYYKRCPLCPIDRTTPRVKFQKFLLPKVNSEALKIHCNSFVQVAEW
jgi:hypothetical protein